MNLNDIDLKGQLKIINEHINTLKNKLDNLYHHLETGKFTGDDLAPRIKELRLQINELETKRNVISEETRSPKTLPLTLKELLNYVQDLARLLNKGSFSERKAFLRSFIKRIVVNHPEVRLDYNFPIINEKGRTSDSEVLPMCKTGSVSKRHELFIFPYVIQYMPIEEKTLIHWYYEHIDFQAVQYSRFSTTFDPLEHLISRTSLRATY